MMFLICNLLFLFDGFRMPFQIAIIHLFSEKEKTFDEIFLEKESLTFCNHSIVSLKQSAEIHSSKCRTGQKKMIFFVWIFIFYFIPLPNKNIVTSKKNTDEKKIDRIVHADGRNCNVYVLQSRERRV